MNRSHCLAFVTTLHTPLAGEGGRQAGREGVR